MNGAAGNEQTNTTMTAPSEQETWSQEDMLILLETMKSIIPSQDSSKFKTTESHMDWNKLAFKNFTGPMCRQKWVKISNQVRKFRTLTEIVHDAEEHVKNPYKGKKLKKHPEFPKKPLTLYFRFFMEKRAKYAKLHPEMSNLDLTKILSKKYKELPDKKKMKYIQDFQDEKQEFEKNLAKFREEHPDLMATKKSDVPEKPKTPQQLWYNHQRKLYLKSNPDASTKDVKDALGKQWSQLSDKKRLKWIHKALEQHKLYENVMREYIQKHPEMNLEEGITRSTLNKAERQLKDKFDGRPTKPPPNRYSMYCAELMANMKDVPSMERMVLCSQRWKLLSQKEKDAYHKKCEQKKKDYEVELLRFLQSLPGEEQRRVLTEGKMMGVNKKGTQASKVSAQDATKAKSKPSQGDKKKNADEREKLPETPKTSEEIWQQSVIGDYLARFKNDRAKALKSMETTWINMEKKEKIMWIKKAAEDQKRYERELSDMRSSPATPTSAEGLSSQDRAAYREQNTNKRKSTTKLKAPSPKSKATAQVKSEEEDDDDDDDDDDNEDEKEDKGDSSDDGDSSDSSSEEDSEDEEENEDEKKDDDEEEEEDDNDSRSSSSSSSSTDSSDSDSN